MFANLATPASRWLVAGALIATLLLVAHRIASIVEPPGRRLLRAGATRLMAAMGVTGMIPFQRRSLLAPGPERS